MMDRQLPAQPSSQRGPSHHGLRAERIGTAAPAAPVRQKPRRGLSRRRAKAIFEVAQGRRADWTVEVRGFGAPRPVSGSNGGHAEFKTYRPVPSAPFAAEPVFQTFQIILTEIVILIQHGDLAVRMIINKVFRVDMSLCLITRLKSHRPWKIFGIIPRRTTGAPSWHSYSREWRHSSACPGRQKSAGLARPRLNGALVEASWLGCRNRQRRSD